MTAQEQSQQWQQTSEAVFTHLAQWREAHPETTMAEIEAEVDAQIQKLRAQVLQETAQASPQETQQSPVAWPQCGGTMQARGKRERRLQTQGGQRVRLRRTYLSCVRCGYGG